MATLHSYDLNGKKLSFANWISNIVPTDTPFVSMTGKEAIKNTLFSWQTDVLAAPNAANAVEEGSTVTDATHVATTERDNYTQILRKVVNVSDSANAMDNYGRASELAYQMEKAGKELKRDLETILLSNQSKQLAAAGTPGKTDCFQRLVGTGTTGEDPDTATGAVVVKTTAGTATLTEAEIFDMTYQLYLAGSEANIIMFHPVHASFFASLMETPASGSQRMRMFEGMDTKFNKYVSSIVDPLGQEFRLIPNRFMPDNAVYFFNPKDWTQMVLRAPQRIKLDKKGSFEQYFIEMEVGLRHRNPYASAILHIA